MEATRKKGFTLVELLVVIAIIAVLSTVGLVTYSTVQKSGRTSKRIQDLKAIQTALELYYSTNKSYPTTGGNWRSECSTWGSYTADQVVKDTVNGNLLVPKYMPAFPSDPAMDTTNNTSCYLYRSDGVDYKLLDYKVTEFTSTDYLSQKNFIDPARDGGTQCSKVDLPDPCNNCISAWAIYSTNTGIEDTTNNPACW